MLNLFSKKDKLLHLLAGMLISQFAFIALQQFVCFALALALAFSFTLIIGATKELIYDKVMENGVCDIKDFHATLIGGAMGTLLTTLIQLL